MILPFLSESFKHAVIGGNRTDCFLAGFAKCRGKQESPPSFMFSNKERTNAQQNSFSRSVREVDYRKGRC